MPSSGWITFSNFFSGMSLLSRATEPSNSNTLLSPSNESTHRHLGLVASNRSPIAFHSLTGWKLCPAFGPKTEPI